MASKDGLLDLGTAFGRQLYAKLAATDKAVLFLVLLFVARYALHQFSKRSNLPPGPRPTPFVGHTFQVPTEKSWLYFHSLCKKYGPIVRLSLGGNDMLVLDDLKDIDELLVKRSNNFSSRKQLVYAGKYRSHDKRLVLLPYGPLLKKQRAAVFQMLNARVVGGYEQIQERGSMKLLSDMLKAPTKAYLNVKWYTAETLFMLVYGKNFGVDGSELRTVLHILENFIQDMHPRAHLVDTFPVLDWLPDSVAPWRQEAKNKHEMEYAFYSGLLGQVKQRMDAGETLECFAARLWEQNEKLGLDELSMAYVAGSAFEAGTDNTAGTILWFLVAILNYPEALKKAQAELDSVLGRDGYTPPSFQHLEQLPYCVALVKEVFRWMPVAPVSAPHSSLHDDEYKGYKIAAGTIVVPNIWAIHHNESAYPEPFKFYPDRFLPKAGETLSGESLNEGHSGFGFGRRTCPGQYLASKSVWIGIVSLLWAFDFKPPLESSGKEIRPDPAACRNGLTAEPDKFDVVLSPRSSNHAETIKRLSAN